MMGERGHVAMQTAQRGDRPQRCERRRAAAHKWNRVQDEPFRGDGRRARADSGGHVHLEASIPRGTRHRQWVRKESPIFGDDVEEPPRRSCRRRLPARREFDQGQTNTRLALLSISRLLAATKSAASLHRRSIGRKGPGKMMSPVW